MISSVTDDGNDDWDWQGEGGGWWAFPYTAAAHRVRSAHTTTSALYDTTINFTLRVAYFPVLCYTQSRLSTPTSKIECILLISDRTLHKT